MGKIPLSNPPLGQSALRPRDNFLIADYQRGTIRVVVSWEQIINKESLSDAKSNTSGGGMRDHSNSDSRSSSARGGGSSTSARERHKYLQVGAVAVPTLPYTKRQQQEFEEKLKKYMEEKMEIEKQQQSAALEELEKQKKEREERNKNNKKNNPRKQRSISPNSRSSSRNANNNNSLYGGSSTNKQKKDVSGFSLRGGSSSSSSRQNPFDKNKNTNPQNSKASNTRTRSTSIFAQRSKQREEFEKEQKNHALESGFTVIGLQEPLQAAFNNTLKYSVHKTTIMSKKQMSDVEEREKHSVNNNEMDSMNNQSRRGGGNSSSLLGGGGDSNRSRRGGSHHNDGSTHGGGGPIDLSSGAYQIHICESAIDIEADQIPEDIGFIFVVLGTPNAKHVSLGAAKNVKVRVAYLPSEGGGGSNNPQVFRSRLQQQGFGLCDVEIGNIGPHMHSIKSQLLLSQSNSMSDAPAESSTTITSNINDSKLSMCCLCLERLGSTRVGRKIQNEFTKGITIPPSMRGSSAPGGASLSIGWIARNLGSGHMNFLPLPQLNYVLSVVEDLSYEKLPRDHHHHQHQQRNQGGKMIMPPTSYQQQNENRVTTTSRPTSKQQRVTRFIGEEGGDQQHQQENNNAEDNSVEGIKNKSVLSMHQTSEEEQQEQQQQQQQEEYFNNVEDNNNHNNNNEDFQQHDDQMYNNANDNNDNNNAGGGGGFYSNYEQQEGEIGYDSDPDMMMLIEDQMPREPVEPGRRVERALGHRTDAWHQALKNIFGRHDRLNQVEYWVQEHTLQNHMKQPIMSSSNQTSAVTSRPGTAATVFSQQQQQNINASRPGTTQSAVSFAGSTTSTSIRKQQKEIDEFFSEDATTKDPNLENNNINISNTHAASHFHFPQNRQKHQQQQELDEDHEWSSDEEAIADECFLRLLDEAQAQEVIDLKDEDDLESTSTSVSSSIQHQANLLKFHSRKQQRKHHHKRRGRQGEQLEKEEEEFDTDSDTENQQQHQKKMKNKRRGSETSSGLDTDSDLENQQQNDYNDEDEDDLDTATPISQSEMEDVFQNAFVVGSDHRSRIVRHGRRQYSSGAPTAVPAGSKRFHSVENPNFSCDPQVLALVEAGFGAAAAQHHYQHRGGTITSGTSTAFGELTEHIISEPKNLKYSGALVPVTSKKPRFDNNDADNGDENENEQQPDENEQEENYHYSDEVELVTNKTNNQNNNISSLSDSSQPMPNRPLIPRLGDALPNFDNDRVTRYDRGCYNLGTKTEDLVGTYLRHRREYTEFARDTLKKKLEAPQDNRPGEAVLPRFRYQSRDEQQDETNNLLLDEEDSDSLLKIEDMPFLEQLALQKKMMQGGKGTGAMLDMNHMPSASSDGNVGGGENYSAGDGGAKSISDTLEKDGPLGMSYTMMHGRKRPQSKSSSQNNKNNLNASQFGSVRSNNIAGASTRPSRSTVKLGSSRRKSKVLSSSLVNQAQSLFADAPDIRQLTSSSASSSRRKSGRSPTTSRSVSPSMRPPLSPGGNRRRNTSGNRRKISPGNKTTKSSSRPRPISFAVSGGASAKVIRDGGNATNLEKSMTQTDFGSKQDVGLKLINYDVPELPPPIKFEDLAMNRRQEQARTQTEDRLDGLRELIKTHDLGELLGHKGDPDSGVQKIRDVKKPRGDPKTMALAKTIAMKGSKRGVGGGRSPSRERDDVDRDNKNIGRRTRPGTTSRTTTRMSSSTTKSSSRRRPGTSPPSYARGRGKNIEDIEEENDEDEEKKKGPGVFDSELVDPPRKDVTIVQTFPGTHSYMVATDPNLFVRPSTTSSASATGGRNPRSGTFSNSTLVPVPPATLLLTNNSPNNKNQQQQQQQYSGGGGDGNNLSDRNYHREMLPRPGIDVSRKIFFATPEALKAGLSPRPPESPHHQQNAHQSNIKKSVKGSSSSSVHRRLGSSSLMGNANNKRRNTSSTSRSSSASHSPFAASTARPTSTSSRHRIPSSSTSNSSSRLGSSQSQRTNNNSTSNYGSSNTRQQGHQPSPHHQHHTREGLIAARAEQRDLARDGAFETVSVRQQQVPHLVLSMN